MTIGAVNLTELSEALGVSVNTLRDVTRKNDDFPVLARGSNGIAYEFDPQACAAWWRANDAKVSAETASRRAALQQLRMDLGVADERAAAETALSAQDRKSEIEAELALDKLRRTRGELVERALMQAVADEVAVELRQGMQQIPIEFARMKQLSREDRLDLQTLIERQLGDLARRLSNPDFFGDPDALAAE